MTGAAGVPLTTRCHDRPSQHDWVLSGKDSRAVTSHRIPVPVATRGSLHSSNCWGSCSPLGGGNYLLPPAL